VKAPVTNQEQLIPTPDGLMPFRGGDHTEKKEGIPFSFKDYVELLTTEQIRVYMMNH
jgi:hypothetical protein